jgi:hypothetical protein
MKKLILTLIFGAALSMTAGTLTNAQTLISLNFQGNDTVGLASGDNAGAAPYAAINWNNVTGGSYSGAPIVLNDSTGTPTAVTLNSFGAGYLSSSSGPNSDNSTPQNILFGGAVSSNSSFGSGPMNFTVSGLGGFSSYDLVVYYEGGDSFPTARDVTVTASGSALTYYGSGINNAFTAYTQSTSTTSGTFPNANYIVFSGLTAASETVSITTSDYMQINGFQLSGTLDAVPEPSTWALMFGGLGLLIGLRQFRNRNV